MTTPTPGDTHALPNNILNPTVAYYQQHPDYTEQICTPIHQAHPYANNLNETYECYNMVPIDTPLGTELLQYRPSFEERVLTIFIHKVTGECVAVLHNQQY
jgi:hypothetical protein